MKPNYNAQILKLMYDLAAGQPYHAPSYTTIQDFAPSFQKNEEVCAKFFTEPPLPKSDWVPEDPYPKIYTKHYKKTILSS